MVKKFGLFFFVALALVVSLLFVLADHEVTTSTGGNSFSVNQSVSNLYNITVNNTDAGQLANITSVNITLPTGASCTFVDGSNSSSIGSNGTTVADSFVNVSNTLSWTNTTGYVINGSEWKYFWFNATCTVSGTYNITVRTTNITGDYEANIAFEVNDTTPPAVSYNGGDTGTTLSGNYSQTWIYFNATCTDENGLALLPDVPAVVINGSSSQLQQDGNNWWINKTLGDGTYDFYINCTDIAGNSNQTENRTVVLDTTPPSLTINSPTNIIYNTSSILFNVTAIDTTTSISSCWYSINGAINQTLTQDGSTNFYNYTNSSVPDAVYTAQFWCNDSEGNLNNTESVEFTVVNSVVSGCRTLNVANATYTLNQSIDSGADGDCILIANESIVLDCAGYNITYYGNSSGGNGIFVFDEGTQAGYTNVTIRNCIVIQNESSGINSSSAIFFGINSTNATVYNNTMITYGNGSYGVYFNNGSVNANVSLNNATTSGNESHGIFLGINGTNANIDSNIVTTSGDDSSGIMMADNSSGLVYNNTILTSGDLSSMDAMGGIFLETGTADINVSSNNITMSGYNNAGIWVWSCSNHSIENNVITASGEWGDGIYLADVQGINVTSNTITITGELGDGIHSVNSETVLLFYDNYITTSGNESYGFDFNQDSNSNVSSNNVTTAGNESYGIYFYESHNSTITHNIVKTGEADSYILYLWTASGHSFYNNIFNTSTSGSGVFINDSDLNYFNTTNNTPTNIMGRAYIGGNFWTNVNGSGYSDICINLDDDYFCDSAYVVMTEENHTDYLPLADHVSVASACATLNIASRYYVLNQSIEVNGTCFNITANNITLDFAGFNVTGNASGYGINISGYNDTSVLNGSIYNFSNGIYISSSSGNIFTDININGSQQDAILLTGAISDNNNFTRVVVTNTNSSYHDVNFSTAGIDGIWIEGIEFANYSFAGVGGLVNFKEPSFGEIVFLDAINGSGISLASDVDVGSNWVFVNSSSNPGLNKSANVSFYLVVYTDPQPQYSLDNSIWVNCTTSTSPACVEFSFTTGSTFKFNVTYPTYFKIIEAYSAGSDDDDSSSSSSSGSGDVSPTYFPTEEKLRAGYTLTVRKDYKVKFDVGDENHTLSVDSVGENSVQITVSSEPQIKTLLVGDEVKFELDGDSIYDFSVKLESISGSSAKLLMKIISEKIPDSELATEGNDSLIGDVDEVSDGADIVNGSGGFWIWFGIIGIVLVVVVGIIYFRLKKE